MRIIGASNFAPAHDLLLFWVNVVTIGAFLIVNSVLVYFLIRYRRRSDKDITSPIDHNLPLEIAWTVIPTIIMAILAVWGIQAFINLRLDHPNAREIQVLGKQWAWSFIYPRDFDEKKQTDGVVLKTNNVLYLEDNKPIKLIMKSSDVIHSLFIPAFRVKEDVVPNIYTYINIIPLLKPNQNGRAEYDIFCAEYCGKDHSAMLAKVIILDRKSYVAEMQKVKVEATDISVARGKKIHQTQCISCHTVDGNRGVGPTWKGVWNTTRALESGETVDVDENYIRNSILDPNQQITVGYPAVMPAQDLSDAEIASIIEYFKELR